MTEPLHFMMGQYKAQIPTDRYYCSRHMWLKQLSDDTFRVGFTDYSVRLLQDVYFLDWSIDEQSKVENRQEIGEIESSKAVSAIYAPCDGRILQFNHAILDDPALINTDNYDTGWLFTIATNAPLLQPVEYQKVLEDGWEETQRLIKGQMN